ncbi:MAG: glycosyltransferase family 2 protein [Gammaproteobacteria bacterium]|nr:glycosyltransferase family 2 protein [Gammaproteobacteria bacterium]
MTTRRRKDQNAPSLEKGPPPVIVTVVTPIYQEEDNVEVLCGKLFDMLDGLGQTFEVIAVNDGSTDRSLERLKAIAERRRELKVINLARNQGQTAAIMAGIEYASGETLVFIDADLQNDPEDIPKLLEKLDEGYDVVSGWRASRKDAAIRRNFVSRAANSLISKLSGVHLHDYGCTLKAYRRKYIKGVRLYGEMHRFIPIYASWMGARIAEMPVRHHSRQHGTSKYGLERVAKVMLDLMVVMFLDRYLAKPIYIFGGFGIFSLVVSALCGGWMVVLKYYFDTSMIQTPLPVVTAMTFLVGMMSIFIGLVAEIVVRTYFESQARKSYHIAETINLDIEA